MFKKRNPDKSKKRVIVTSTSDDSDDNATETRPIDIIESAEINVDSNSSSNNDKDSDNTQIKPVRRKKKKDRTPKPATATANLSFAAENNDEESYHDIASTSLPFKTSKSKKKKHGGMGFGAMDIEEDEDEVVGAQIEGVGDSYADLNYLLKMQNYSTKRVSVAAAAAADDDDAATAVGGGEKVVEVDSDGVGAEIDVKMDGGGDVDRDDDAIVIDEIPIAKEDNKNTVSSIIQNISSENDGFISMNPNSKKPSHKPPPPPQHQQTNTRIQGVLQSDSDSEDDEIKNWENEMLHRGRGGGAPAPAASVPLAQPTKTSTVDNVTLTSKPLLQTLHTTLQVLTQKLQQDSSQKSRLSSDLQTSITTEETLAAKLNLAKEVYEWGLAIRKVLSEFVGAIREFNCNVELVLVNLKSVLIDYGLHYCSRRELLFPSTGKEAKVATGGGGGGGVDEFGRSLRLVKSSDRDTKRIALLDGLALKYGNVDSKGVVCDFDYVGFCEDFDNAKENDESKDSESLKSRLGSLREATHLTIYDIQTKYTSLPSLISIFKAWRKEQFSVYEETYGDLLLIGMCESHVRLEVCKVWGEMGVRTLDDMEWYADLNDYSTIGVGGVNVVSALIKSVISPILCTTLKHSYSIYSKTQTAALQKLTASVLAKIDVSVIADTDNSVFTDTIKAVLSNLKSTLTTLENEIHAIKTCDTLINEGLSLSSLYSFIKLLTNICIWIGLFENAVWKRFIEGGVSEIKGVVRTFMCDVILETLTASERHEQHHLFTQAFKNKYVSKLASAWRGVGEGGVTASVEEGELRKIVEFFETHSVSF